MPDVPVTLTPWFDAKDNPPKDERHVHTDDGALFFCQEKFVWRDNDGWRGKPTVWCDPSPPDMSDPLTVEDMRAIEQMLRYTVKETDFDGDGNPQMAALHARLRRALDQIQEQT